MTTRSLNLRGPVVPIHLKSDVTYGLHRASTGRRDRGFAPAPKLKEDVEEPTTAVSEFIQPEPEAEPFADILENRPTPQIVAPPDAHPGFTEYGGELIPDTGHYTAKTGERWINGIPAFLVEDRPVSRIR